MAYQKNVWQDRVGVGLNRFVDQNGNEYEFTPAPVSVTSEGTPFSAAWMRVRICCVLYFVLATFRDGTAAPTRTKPKCFIGIFLLNWYAS